MGGWTSTCAAQWRYLANSFASTGPFRRDANGVVAIPVPSTPAAESQVQLLLALFLYHTGSTRTSLDFADKTKGRALGVLTGTPGSEPGVETPSICRIWQQ